MRTRLTATSLAVFFSVLALLVGAVAPVVAQAQADWSPGPVSIPIDGKVLAVHHGPVVVTLVNPDSDGHQLGDLRVTSVATTTADGQPLGRLDATLTTTAIDTPAPGDEIRISTLIFSFDDELGSEVDVGGSALYPAQGPTIATGNVTTRPILGGSGLFAGVTGNAVTQHFADDTWVHYLKFDKKPKKPKAAKAPKVPKADKVAPDKAARNDAARLAERELRQQIKARLQELKDARRALRQELRAAPSAQPQAAPSAQPNTLDLGNALGDEAGAGAIKDVGVIRTDLGITSPGSAPGQELGLWHYLIPAGAQLEPHTHPGWQVARIASGDLEYTIIAGEGTLIHADGSSESVGPGTYTFHAGDTIVENPGLQHYGANRTSQPVIIVAATLFPAGAPLSSPLDNTTE